MTANWYYIQVTTMDLETSDEVSEQYGPFRKETAERLEKEWRARVLTVFGGEEEMIDLSVSINIHAMRLRRADEFRDELIEVVKQYRYSPIEGRLIEEGE